jgi:uncharacterized protein YqgV (UPF0045/DUF77 family)
MFADRFAMESSEDTCMRIQAELCLYPLRELHLGNHIDAFLETIRRDGISMSSGTMSTVISGERELVFAAVADAFARVSHNCDIVLHVTYSNACPSCARTPRVTPDEEP